MSIRKRPVGPLTDPVRVAAMDRAIAAGDFERAALLLLIDAVRTLNRGSIDDLISELAGEEPLDERA